MAGLAGITMKLAEVVYGPKKEWRGKIRRGLAERQRGVWKERRAIRTALRAAGSSSRGLGYSFNALGVDKIRSVFSGFDDAWNVMEGFLHGGMSGGVRSRNTDFGSGYQGLLAGGDLFQGHPDVRSTVYEWLDRASMLDIETTGLDPTARGVGIWEGAVGIRQPGGEMKFPVDMYVRPSQVTPEGGQRFIEPSEVTEWTKQSMKSKGVGDIPWREGVPRSTFIKESLHAVKGTDLWVQNLAFESRHYAHNLTDKQFEDWARAADLQNVNFERSEMTGELLNQRRLFVSSEIVEKAVGEAWKATNAQRVGSWAQVYGAIREEMIRGAAPGETRVFDLQHLSRSMFALAQEQGYMRKTGDVFTGTSVDVFSRLGLGAAEEHRAAADIKVQNQMTESYMAMAEKMWTGKTLSQSEKRYLRAVSEVQPQLRRQNAAKTISKIYESIERGEAYEVIRSRDTVVRKWRDEKTGDLMRKEYTVANYKQIRSMDEAVAHLVEKQRMDLRGGMDPRMKVDYDKIYKRFIGEVVVPHQEMGSDMGKLIYGWERKHKVKDAFWNELSMSRGLTAGSVIRKFKETGAHMRGNWKYYAAAAAAAGLAYKIMGDDSPEASWHDLELARPETVRPLHVPGKVGREEYTGAREGVLTEVPITPRLRKMGLNDKLTNSLALFVPKNKGMFRVEDADTVFLSLDEGGPQGFRLAGIDAPEIAHPEQGYTSNRVFQDQPHGRRSTEMLRQMINEADQVGVLYDPEADKTYGRTVGVLMALKDREVTNLNLELAKRGGASYLPFGRAKDSLIRRKAFRDAEKDAAKHSRGMFQEEAWQIERTLSKGQKRRMTHVTLTDPQRLSQDFRAAATLRRMREDSENASKWMTAGGKDDYQMMEGIKHGWFSKVNTHKRLGRRRRQEAHANVIASMNLDKENHIKHHMMTGDGHPVIHP